MIRACIAPARSSLFDVTASRPCLSSLQRSSLPKQFTQHRCFFQTSRRSEEAKVLAASRVLPYPTYSIFKTIADINSYPSFLPYVTGAKVLENSPRPDSHHKETWPALAALSIGFQDKISEKFTSRVFCVPPGPHKGSAGVGFVEALSGSKAPKPTFTADEDVSHYDLEQQQPTDEVTQGPLAFLRTRWTVSAYPHKPAPASGEETHAADLSSSTKAQEMTNVSLIVEYRFDNPLYDMLGQAAQGKVADKMIEAFEKRVKDILGGNLN